MYRSELGLATDSEDESASTQDLPPFLSGTGGTNNDVKSQGTEHEIKHPVQGQNTNQLNDKKPAVCLIKFLLVSYTITEIFSYKK